VAENLLDHIALATLDEADDLHLSAATRALQWVDFIDTLDEPRPRGKRAARLRRLSVERRTINGEFV